MKYLLFLIVLIVSAPSFADWHAGKVKHIGIGYNGTTVTVSLEGWNRNDCTCYSTWPTYMCLDETRPTHDFEKALILAARARGSSININIDEATCKVIAVYEE